MSFFRRLYQFDYMGHKLWWFALSGIIIAIGLVSLAVNGLEFGLEFQEGTRITVAFETPPPLGELRAAVAEAGYPNAQIQQTANVSGSGVEGFQLQTPMLSAEQQAELRTTLDEQFPIESSAGKLVWGVETVSASFGKQVASSSLKAMGIALLLILVYVTFRFQWKYAVGAIAAEVHDLLIVVGIYSLTGREGPPPRSRRCSPSWGTRSTTRSSSSTASGRTSRKLGRMPYADMVNESLWETLTRSLNTSFMSLLPVLCLFFFGGRRSRTSPSRSSWASSRARTPRSSSRVPCSRCSRSVSPGTRSSRPRLAAGQA